MYFCSIWILTGWDTNRVVKEPSGFRFLNAVYGSLYPTWFRHKRSQTAPRPCLAKTGAFQQRQLEATASG
jgi:hypothetical protein